MQLVSIANVIIFPVLDPQNLQDAILQAVKSQCPTNTMTHRGVKERLAELCQRTKTLNLLLRTATGLDKKEFMEILALIEGTWNREKQPVKIPWGPLTSCII